MADKTGIEWTDATWNPIAGCTIVSPGCTNCYAMHMAARLEAMGRPKYAGLTRKVNGKSVWTGNVRVASPWSFDEPLRWTRPRRIFVNSMSDLFHEAVDDATIDAVFAVMGRADELGRGHVFQVLTKRAERMRDYMKARAETAWNARRIGRVPHPPGNVWLGVSVERQTEADARIPLLLDTPAAVRWISAEPLLGPVDLTAIKRTVSPGYVGDCLQWYHQPRCDKDSVDYPRVDWVVAGGESGPDARPMHPEWVRDIRDACATAGVPFFFKQWGEWAPGENAPGVPMRTERTASWWADKWSFGTITVKASEELHRDDEPDLYRFGKRAAGATLDGREHKEWPR